MASIVSTSYELFSSYLGFLCLIAPTIEVICMLVMIYLCSASQQRLVIAFTLSTIKIHMIPYKYIRKAFLQFPCTLAGESPKWNILVVTWELVICLKYMYSCPCYNYYIYMIHTYSETLVVIHTTGNHMVFIKTGQCMAL